jgi:hypothetical protein
MKRRGFTDEQSTVGHLGAEGGTPIVDGCGRIRVSEVSANLWKKKGGKLGLTESWGGPGAKAPACSVSLWDSRWASPFSGSRTGKVLGFARRRAVADWILERYHPVCAAPRVSPTPHARFGVR